MVKLVLVGLFFFFLQQIRWVFFVYTYLFVLLSFFSFLLLRATAPRYRIDQLIMLIWKYFFFLFILMFILFFGAYIL